MKINVAVLFGGKSVEHEISVISAQQAMHAMNKEKYQVTPVYITKQNEFYTGEALLSMDEYKNIPKLLAKCDRVDLVKEEAGVFLNYHTKKAFQKPSICKIDVAFPVVHGTNVEDGALQGFLETLCLPYVGCDVTASAVGMDKYVMKTVLKDKGIPVLDCMCFYAREFLKDADSVLNKLEVRFSYPVIVKPANLGSSVGIKIAKDRASLTSAIENAAGYAAKILVEKAITNLREINCSVLGDSDGTKASVCEEPVGGDEILSYKDKYLSGGKSAKSQGMSSLKKRLPADLAADTTEKIRQMAQDTFLAIGASGVSRIDFMIDEDTGEVFVNEINTIPGSLSFYLWEATGLSFADLTDQLICLALKRQRQRSNLIFSYDTNILSANALTNLKNHK